MNVYMLTQNDRFDTRPAEEFGRIKYLYEHSPSPFDPGLLMSSIVRNLQKEGFDPVVDAICLTGPAMILAQFFAAVCCRYNTVNVLIFNAGTSSYILETISTKEVKNDKGNSKPIKQSNSWAPGTRPGSPIRNNPTTKERTIG